MQLCSVWQTKSKETPIERKVIEGLIICAYINRVTIFPATYVYEPRNITNLNIILYLSIETSSK